MSLVSINGSHIKKGVGMVKDVMTKCKCVMIAFLASQSWYGMTSYHNDTITRNGVMTKWNWGKASNHGTV